MLVHEGKVCLYNFLLAVVVIFAIAIPEFRFKYSLDNWLVIFWSPLLLYGILNFVIYLYYSASSDYQVAIRACFLGYIFSMGLFIFFLAPEHIRAFGLYAVIMGTFHWTEYMGIALSNPKTLSPDSFVLNHSTHYVVAAASSWVEFFLESYFFPQIKTLRLFWVIGFLLCFSGDLLRKVAMITAHSNFTHIVQFVRVEEHKLVTNGVYGCMRHPSYVGWFWWSIGTQIVLVNPVCTILYSIVAWLFFRDRVYVEEITLLNFFGEEYVEYQKKVGTGLPFIHGYHQGMPIVPD
ncbi:protein-S-isoprenylcysteine O-methyltransferase [Phlebotomus papatasi]|uniref:protein-S-isoprenylcysteine O-methyltransferase n=1 Tax=Phlebotomus papatasi TaxID=29031 RepID=UPI0024844967|nr:protein-S-isoprenylcysteine O-methyltransferase [Phlebotomus papatasi]